jgi:hypothetical protein
MTRSIATTTCCFAVFAPDLSERSRGRSVAWALSRSLQPLLLALITAGGLVDAISQ